MALPVGNHPGNTGGKKGRSGRMRDEVRAAALQGAKKAVPQMIRLLESDEAVTVTRAADVLLKYGLGQQKEVTVDNVRARVEQTLQTIQRLAPPELAQQLIAALQPVWS